MQTKFTTTVTLCFALGTGCLLTPSWAEPNQFSDTGHLPHAEDFHLKAIRGIGRIFDERAKITACTATLVQDRILLTAAHCLTDKTGRPLEGNFRFVPAGESPTSRYTAEVDMSSAVSMTRDWDKIWERDAAFVKIKSSLGNDKYPPVEIKAIADVHKYGQPFSITLTGYFYDATKAQADGYPTTEVCEPIRIVHKSKEFSHNCSTTHGMSGSPVYVMESGRMVLIGIHHGSIIPNGDTPTLYSERLANNGIDGQILLPALNLYQAGDLVPDAI